MKEIIFSVQGSGDEPYEVRFVKRDDDRLNAYCSCQAGQKGMHCKHRINILTGDTTDIVSENAEEVKTIQNWLTGTELEKTLKDFFLAEEAANKAKRKLSSAKKKFAKTMLK